jgi:hypothetical protein
VGFDASRHVYGAGSGGIAYMDGYGVGCSCGDEECMKCAVDGHAVGGLGENKSWCRERQAQARYSEEHIAIVSVIKVCERFARGQCGG